MPCEAVRRANGERHSGTVSPPVGCGPTDNHGGFDGVMLGHAGAGYHLEFTRKAGHAAGKAPTQDNLLVFYLSDAVEWSAAVGRMEAAGYAPVPAFNPYWDRNGKTFEDPDGYRVVLRNAGWSGVIAAPTTGQQGVMRIDHIGLWASDLEAVRAFYETYFGAVAGPKYTNPAKQFESYFLSFPGGDVRLEVMHIAGLVARSSGGPTVGYAHLAITVGSEDAVDALAARLRTAGHDVVDGPRRTGDG